MPCVVRCAVLPGMPSIADADQALRSRLRSSSSYRVRRGAPAVGKAQHQKRLSSPRLPSLGARASVPRGKDQEPEPSSLMRLKALAPVPPTARVPRLNSPRAGALGGSPQSRTPRLSTSRSSPLNVVKNTALAPVDRTAGGVEWRKKMNLGYKCDAQDGTGKWHEGTVVQLAVGTGDSRVKIFFPGLGTDGKNVEEWIPRMSERLQKLGTKSYAGVHDGVESMTKIGGALEPLLAMVMPDATADERQELMIRLADCGVFSAAQLQASIMQWSPAHWLETPIFKGKMRLVNELLVTRSGADFKAPLSSSLLEHIMSLLDPSSVPESESAAGSQPEPESDAEPPLPAWDRAAAGVEANTIDGLMEGPLATALMLLQRPELRKRLMRIGVSSGAKFLALADLDGGKRLLDLPINVAMRDHGMSNIAGDTLKAISEFLIEGGELHATLKPSNDASQRMDGLPLNGTKGKLWDVVSKVDTEACCTLATADGSPMLPLSSRTDVVYFEGSLPLILAIPHGGSEGSDSGSDAAQLLWAGFNVAARENMDCGGGTIALAEAIRERCRLTVGALPHIVVVNLHPSKVCVTKPLREATQRVRDPGAAPSDADLVRQSQLQQRAESAWKNYHTLIECARKRVATEDGAAARAGAGMLLELTSSAATGWMKGIAHLSYGLSTFALQRLGGDTSSTDQANAGAEDEAIAEAFAMFDVDGSGEIDRDELSSVAKELGVPLSEKDLDDAMKQMDEDGSGEVDLQEFTGWYKSLTSSGSSGAPSKLELIKLNSMLASSSIPALGRRQNWSPTQAVFGAGAPGSLLCAYGALVLPSDAHPDPTKVAEEAGFVPRCASHLLACLLWA